MFLIILAIAAIIGLLYFVGVFVGGWLQNIINLYKKGKKIWYIEPLIYLIWYPVKYVGLAIGYVILYVLWKPLYFIIYTFLVETVIINLSKWVWKGLCAFGRGLANGTGVFGQEVQPEVKKSIFSLPFDWATIFNIAMGILGVIGGGAMFANISTATMFDLLTGIPPCPTCIQMTSLMALRPVINIVFFCYILIPPADKDNE